MEKKLSRSYYPMVVSLKLLNLRTQPEFTGRKEDT